MFSCLNDGFVDVFFVQHLKGFGVNWTRSGRIWIILTRTVNKLTVLRDNGLFTNRVYSLVWCECDDFASFLWGFRYLLYGLFLKFLIRFTDGPAHFGLQKHYNIIVSKSKNTKKSHFWNPCIRGDFEKNNKNQQKSVLFIIQNEQSCFKGSGSLSIFKKSCFWYFLNPRLHSRRSRPNFACFLEKIYNPSIVF